MYIRHIVLYTYTIYYAKSVPKSVKISEKILKKDFGKNSEKKVPSRRASLTFPFYKTGNHIAIAGWIIRPIPDPNIKKREVCLTPLNLT